MTNTPTPATVRLDVLRLDPANVRVHGEADLSELAKSLREFGQRRPVVVQRGTELVPSGNGLVQAARRIGLDTVQVLYVDDDDVRARRWALTDNKTGQLAPWDDDALAAALAELDAAGSPLHTLPGFDARELAELLARAELPHDPLHDDVQGPVTLTAPPAPRVAGSTFDPPAPTLPREPLPAAAPAAAPPSDRVGVAFELSRAGYDEFSRLIRAAMQHHRTVDVAGTLLAVLRAAHAEE